MPASTSKALASSLYKRLFRRFGPQHWWPAGSAWEMMAGAILTQNTSWTNVERAISALKQSRALSLRAVARMPRRRLEKLIRPTGYFRQKAERLQRFAKELMKDPVFFCSLGGNSALPPLWGKAGMGGRRESFEPPTSILPHEGGGRTAELRRRLLSLHGFGPETADSILLYAGGYPVFVVDAYTRRIGRRIGLFHTDDYHQVQAFFQQRLPRDAALYNEYHALLVRLAKDVCTKRDPHCSVCPVRQDCVYGRRCS